MRRFHPKEDEAMKETVQKIFENGRIVPSKVHTYTYCLWGKKVVLCVSTEYANKITEKTELLNSCSEVLA
jgi:hypothetical protein